jgi:hypothetical protein
MTLRQVGWFIQVVHVPGGFMRRRLSHWTVLIVVLSLCRGQAESADAADKTKSTDAEMKAADARAAMGAKLLAIADGKRSMNDLSFEIHELSGSRRKIQIQLRNGACTVSVRHDRRVVKKEAVVEFFRFLGPEMKNLRSVESNDDSIKGESCARLDICDEKIVPLEWTTVAVSPMWKHCDEFWLLVLKVLDAHKQAPDEETIAANARAEAAKRESKYDAQLAATLEKIAAGDLALDELTCDMTLFNAADVSFDGSTVTIAPIKIRVFKKAVTLTKLVNSKLEEDNQTGTVRVESRTESRTYPVVSTEAELRNLAKLLAQAAPADSAITDTVTSTVARRIKRLQIQITAQDQHGTLDVDISDPDVAKRLEKVMGVINGFIKKVVADK